MLETVGIMGQSQENLEKYLSLIQHCYSKSKKINY